MQRIVILIFTVILFSLLIYLIIPSLHAQTASLTINVTKPVNPFSNKMLGMALVNWEHAYNKPFPNSVPGLAAAFKEARVGMIRYAGGLWANSVGWDRVNQRTPYTTWTKNGNTYYFHYGTNEIDNLGAFAKATGADVMIQVNISNNDPAMWADMVRYTNVDHNYGFKYWEFGNELDTATDNKIDTATYVARMKTYIDAMKAVDPSIQIVAGVPATAHDAARLGYSDSVTALSQFLTLTAPAVSTGGKKADALSYHWYQACNSSSFADMFLYEFSGTATNSWRNAYSRKWSEIIPSRVQNEIINANANIKAQGITELNFDACNYDNVLNGNHLNAIWFTDIIGRLAYNGLDFVTWYTGYGDQGYSVLYADNANAPTKILTRPSYYAVIMYAKYFGDQMVTTTTYDPTKISIWASTDSKDPGKLKIMVTNLSSAAISAPIAITGFNGTTADVYTMKSTNPTDTSGTSNKDNAPTTINGVKINAMNVATSIATITPAKLTINGSTFTYNFPAYSTTAIIVTTSGSIPPTTPTRIPSIQPSSSPLPTLTGSQNTTKVSVTVLLHGVGKSGDNVNPNSIGNMNPLHPQRSISLEFTNANGQMIAKQGTVTFSSTAGNFQGIVDVGPPSSGINTGAFTVRILSPQYLSKSFPGIVSLTSGGTAQLPSISLTTGDSNNDNHLSILDYNILLDCFSDLTAAKNCADANKKTAADLTDDGSVNQFDYNLFLRELSVQSGQ